MRFVTNHWGWTWRGVGTWLRYGWAWPVAVWGVEVTGSNPQRFARRVKVGPVCFAWGEYTQEVVAQAAKPLRPESK